MTQNNYIKAMNYACSNAPMPIEHLWRYLTELSVPVKSAMNIVNNVCESQLVALRDGMLVLR